MDDRLQLISEQLKETDKEISDLEWSGGCQDRIQSLYLLREHLQHLLQKGDSYIPNF